jgi:hypothetical protein
VNLNFRKRLLQMTTPVLQFSYFYNTSFSFVYLSVFHYITFCEPLLPFLCAIELIHWSSIFLSPCICWHIPVNAALSFIDYNYKFLSILFQISIAHHVLFQSVCACLFVSVRLRGCLCHFFHPLHINLRHL